MTQADSVHSTPPTNTSATHNRRGFLGRAVTALVAGTALNTVAIVATKSAPRVATAEDPTVIALGERIDPLLETYRNAVACHRAARAQAEANCPDVPEEIVCKGPQWLGCTERERDVEDRDVWPPNYVGDDGKTYARPPRRIFNSQPAKAAIARGNLYCDRRTLFGKRLVKLVEAAERYEAGRETAINQSGLTAAKTNLYFACVELERLAHGAAEIKPRTTAGLSIQARALNSYAEAETELDREAGQSGAVVGLALAQSVLRLTNNGMVVM
jgi:hypothetical protein